MFHIPLIQSSATRHWRHGWIKPPRASNRSSLRASSHHLAAVAQHVATKNEVESPLHKQKNVVCFLRMSAVLCMHVYIYIHVCRYKYTYMVFRIKTGKWSAKSAYCHQVISSASIFETTHRLIMVYAIPRCSTLTHLKCMTIFETYINPKRLLVLTNSAKFGYWKESNPKYPKTPATHR